ncbi:MAG: autotransporter domain-containing protein, partial [Planctomycetes bacterium]|nr:autotransporter domain-containing protein [Planctomycetota bacterium]
GKDAMTLSVGGANAITSAGSVLFKANTNILATDSATSLVLGGGDGSAALEGALTLTNDKALQLGAAFASRSAEAGITKRGAGALTLTQADTFRNASFLDLRQGSLASAKNQAFNRLDSAVNTTIAVGGKMTMNEGTLRGRTTAGSFEKNGSGGLTVVGPMTVAGDFALSGGTLNLFLDDRTATINADTATLAPGASLNITGFGSLTEGEECYTAYVPVISTQSGVLSMPDPANVFVAGVTRPICEFMLIRVLTQDDDVVVKYELNWYNEDGETANGLFGIGEKRENSDVSFELGAMLQDRLPGAVDPDNEHGWDGTKLTKGGYGTLILTSNKNRYTGGSFIENGTLVAAAPGALGKEEVELSHQDTTLVLRYDADDFTDASLPTATGNNITGAGRLEIDGNVVYEGDRSGHTGDVAISAGSRFSSGSDETFASNLTMGPGSTMDIDGTFTVTKGSIAGAVTATDMVKQGSDRLIVDGSITLANSLEVSGGLDLMIGDQAPITAPTTTFIDDTILNIRGVSKDGNHRIITSGTINGVLPELLIGGQTPSSDSFLIAGLKQDSDGLYLDTVFAWNHPEFVDDHYHMAHGTFELADDAEFYLNVPLADRDANSKYKDNWDGKTMHKTGAGTLGITCANSFTGGVKIHAGTVNAGCESALGTGAVVIADGARLELEHDGDFSNPLSDSGDVVVRGVQTWLTSPTGIADAYSGTVTVESGSVTLGTTRTNTYETGGTFALAADTALAGNGSIGGLTLASGARVAPGHSVGALTVNGDVVFEAGSIYEVETDPEDEGVADHIMVNGTADLGGATVRHTGIGEEDAYPSVGEWVILTASEGYGDSRFADTVESRYLFLDETLLYEGNDVLLRVGRSGSFSDYAGTPNQLAVANVLDGMDDASSLYNRLLGATDADSMPAAYDQLSGEMHPSLRRLLADSDRDFGFSLMDRASRPGVQDDAFPIWAEGQGFENRANGRAGVAKSRLYGVRATIGAEKTFLGGWLLGGAFRYGNTTFKVDERNSKADVDSFSFGLYAGRDVAMDLGTLRLNLGAAYSYHDIDSERRLTHTLLGQTLEADYKAHAFQAIGDLGFAFFLNRLEVEPYLRLGVHSIRTRGFSERGGDAALSAAGERTTNVSQTLGVRTALPVTERFTARAGAGWIHTYGQKDARSAFRFIDGGDAFSINGVTVPRNAVKVQLGLDINLTSRADLYVGYDGYLGSGTGNHAGRVALQVNF